MDHQTHNLHSAALMLLAITCYAVIPLGVAQLGGAQNPFEFNAAWRTGIILGFGAFMTLRYPNLFLNPRVWALIIPNLWDWRILAVTLAYLDIALFALATKFVDVSVATIVAETSPIFLILMMSFSYRTTSRYRRISPQTFLFAGIALGGFALVVMSQSTGTPSPQGHTGWAMPVGILLSLASALFSALNAFSFPWGTDLVDQLPQNLKGPAYSISDQLFGVVMTGFIANSLAVPINLGVGFATGETIPATTFLLAAVAGALTYPLAGIAWRLANLMTHNLGINAIGYTRPLISLGILAPFSQIGVARPAHLIAGAACIITANLWINFEDQIRTAARVLLAPHTPGHHNDVAE